MFCCYCGEQVGAGAQFCQKCGKELVSASKDSRTPTIENVASVSFDNFLKRKAMERTTLFEPKAANAKIVKSSPAAKPRLEVIINTGIMKLNSEGKLKKCRGKTLPLKVTATASENAILEAAVRKHSAFDKSFNAEGRYILLYPDCTEVEKTPGTQKDFVLQDYGKEIGRAFRRITLYIATKTDFTFSEISSIDDNIFDSDHEYEDDAIDNSDSDESKDLKKPVFSSSTEVAKSQPSSASDTGREPTIQRRTSTAAVACSGPAVLTPSDPSISNGSIHQCPTCFLHFSFTEIASHADECAESWVDPIGECIVVHDDSEVEDAMDEDKDKEQDKDLNTSITNLRSVLQNNAITNRISIRRSSPFADYAAARKKNGSDPKAPSRSPLSVRAQDENFSQVTDCKTDEQLREVLCEDAMMDVLQTVGYRGIPSKQTLRSVPDITRSMVISGISKTLTVIDQLVAGLGYQGGLFMDYVRSHKQVMQPLFTISGARKFQLTADLLLDNMNAEYSEDGSNLKALEVNIFKYFSDFFPTEGVLSQLFKFVTRSDRLTPTGSGKVITVRFNHGCMASCRCRPTASTCDPSINLPIHYQDPRSFEDIMKSALEEGVGFGLV